MMRDCPKEGTIVVMVTEELAGEIAYLKSMVLILPNDARARRENAATVEASLLWAPA